MPSHVPHKLFSQGEWRAQITINGKTVHLGYFDENDEEGAARAYDEVARKQGRRTNFTPDGTPGDAMKLRQAARQSKFTGVYWNNG